MRLKEITLKNFKAFVGEHNIKLFSLNLFYGENGSGKSSIILDSILFTLYGYSPNILTDLITAGQKNCFVNLFLEYNNTFYSITREIPSKLTILENGVPVQGSIKIKQEYINKLFNDITWFKKFRLFDVKEGINILEESGQSLQKTLLNFDEEKLNSLRNKLLEIKRERDVYNISNISVSSHYPSANRLTILKNGILLFNNLINKVKNKINDVLNSINQVNRNLGGFEYNIKNLIKKKNDVKGYTTCPTCLQSVSVQHKNLVEKEVNKQKTKDEKQITSLKLSLSSYKSELDVLKNKETSYQQKLSRVNSLIQTLENRIAYSNYKWTPKDLEVAKKCIKEVDNFYSFYLLESVKNLEPLINHILSKIKFKLKFIINDKNKFDFVVYKHDTPLNYKQLSTGQKLIVSIAMKMALLLENGETGLIISDEGLSSLSENNLTLIFELIQEYPFQLLSVVHRYENPLNCLKLFHVKEGKIDVL